MDHDSTLRAVLIVVMLLLLPVGVYHRVKSQSTGETLDRRREGLFILATLRPLGEEENLVARFGDNYRAYMARTGRFVPKIG